MKHPIFILLCICLLVGCTPHQTEILVSGYGGSQDTCLRSYILNENTGEVSEYASLSGLVNPSYFTVSRSGRTIFAVSEQDEAHSGVYVIRQSFKQLSLLDHRSTGAGPCYIAVDPTRRFAVTANYGAGSLSILFINTQDGTLKQGEKAFEFTGHGPVAGRQDQSHVHCISFTPDGLFVIAIDLGTDQLHIYPLRGNDEEKLLYHTQRFDMDLTPGSGPRHMVWSPTNKAYLINEISGTIVVFDYHEGQLTPIQQVVCDSLGAHGSGDIQLSPDGEYLYATNRLQGDGIAIYHVDEATGMLTQVGYQPSGKHPRSIMITQSGHYLLCACRDDNRVEIYRRNPKTGLLLLTEHQIDMPRPVCVKECPVRVMN